MSQDLGRGLRVAHAGGETTYSISSLRSIVLSGLSFETFLVGELSVLSCLFFGLTFGATILVTRFRFASPDFSPLAPPLFSLPKALVECPDTLP